MNLVPAGPARNSNSATVGWVEQRGRQVNLRVVVRIDVIAGILVDAAGRVLIAERLYDHPMAGYWEFPGGKIHAGETAEAALERELAEELGISELEQAPFMQLDHDYPDRRVSLDFRLVTSWCGDARGLEGQRLQWQLPDAIDEQTLLPADAPVLKALRESLGPNQTD